MNERMKERMNDTHSGFLILDYCQLGCNNDCYDEVCRNSCYDEAGCTVKNLAAGDFNSNSVEVHLVLDAELGKIFYLLPEKL